LPLRVCRETASLKLAKLRGVTFVNQYVVIKYLGRGACGRVFLCMDMYDNRLYAVKVGLILVKVPRISGLPCSVLQYGEANMLQFAVSCTSCPSCLQLWLMLELHRAFPVTVSVWLELSLKCSERCLVALIKLRVKKMSEDTSTGHKYEARAFGG
jgi:hypothetical protein